MKPKSEPRPLTAKEIEHTVDPVFEGVNTGFMCANVSEKPQGNIVSWSCIKLHNTIEKAYA